MLRICLAIVLVTSAFGLEVIRQEEESSPFKYHLPASAKREIDQNYKLQELMQHAEEAAQKEAKHEEKVLAKQAQEQQQEATAEEQKLAKTMEKVSAPMALYYLDKKMSKEARLAQKEKTLLASKSESKQQDHDAKKLEELKKFNFADFVRQFNRQWTPGTEEWKKREELFQKNLQKIVDHHSGPKKAWTKGINKFMDYTDEEFKKLLGHKPGRKEMSAGSFMQTNTTKEDDDIELPVTHSWKPKMLQSSSFSRDQGACGSCWAFAAVQALEGHLEIKHQQSTKLSAQMLVSCMPNLHNCGGTGGCEGATANLAFDYIKEHGIPTETTWPYTSFSGRDGSCSQALLQQPHVKIEKWVHLPVNEDKPLARALYQHGPVVVSVDGSPWSFYQSGIFHGCEKDTIINHAVVAEGFGEEASERTNKVHKYYLIKNSWGSDWGEDGYIRLERFEDSNEYCGIDKDPKQGNGCDGGPEEIPVCGMCGVTADSSFPVNPSFAEAKGIPGQDFLTKGFKDMIARR